MSTAAGLQVVPLEQGRALVSSFVAAGRTEILIQNGGHTVPTLNDTEVCMRLSPHASITRTTATSHLCPV